MLAPGFMFSFEKKQLILAIEYEGKFGKSINVERRKDSRQKKKFSKQRKREVKKEGLVGRT